MAAGSAPTSARAVGSCCEPGRRHARPGKLAGPEWTFVGVQGAPDDPAGIRAGAHGPRCPLERQGRFIGSALTIRHAAERRVRPFCRPDHGRSAEEQGGGQRLVELHSSSRELVTGLGYRSPYRAGARASAAVTAARDRVQACCEAIVLEGRRDGVHGRVPGRATAEGADRSLICHRSVTRSRWS
jgi:hypothetical protein